MKPPSNTLLAAAALGAVAAEKIKEEEAKAREAGGAAGAARDLADAGLEMQAEEAVKRGASGLPPEFQPHLIEGHLEGSLVEVPMPTGETWRYSLPDCCAAPCPVLVCVLSREAAHVFRPSAEGVHPYLRTVRRFGVDQPRKGGAL